MSTKPGAAHPGLFVFPPQIRLSLACLRLAEIVRYQPELFERCFEVVDDFLGDDVGVGKIGGVFEGVVFEPEDVEAGFVAGDQLVIIVGAPTAVGFLVGPGGFAIVAIAHGPLVGPVVMAVVAFHELIEVFALKWIGLEREVLVGAEVVDPELLGPGGLARRFLVEEEHVGFHALRIEEAGRQTQERVYLALVQELAPDSLTRPTFEEDVVRHHDRGPAILLQQGFDVLDEIELLVGSRRPEVVTLDDIPFLGDLPLFANDRRAALLSKRRIGHHDVEPVTRISGQGVGHHDGQVFVIPDPVEHQVHRAEPCRALDQFPSLERALLQLSLFVLGQVGIVLHDIVMGSQEKPAGPAGRVADGVAGLRSDGLHHRDNQRPWGEVLARAGFGVLGVLLQ